MKTFHPHKYGEIYYQLLINSKDKNENDKAPSNNMHNFTFVIGNITIMHRKKIKHCWILLDLFHSRMIKK